MTDAPKHTTRFDRHSLLDAARDQRAAGVTMTIATVVALLWANVASASYHEFWARSVALPGVDLSAQEWVNEALMVAFFVLIGFEIRREVAGGELRSWRHASAPLAAALGGMAVPAVIYAVVVHGGEGSRGWGIPMATDVAFALGALALAGASTRTRVFLLTLAVADDIASVVILIAFYGNDVRFWSLLAAVACLALMVVLHASRVRSALVLLVLGALAWWALVHAGVEASVVGVAIGLLLPPAAGRVRSSRRAERRAVRSLEHQLEPWVNVVVLPVFALANVGVTFSGSDLFSRPAMTVFLAVFLARVIGKPVGIATTAWALSRSGGHDRLHLGRRERLGVGAVAAVGFTVPLLIVHAALPPGPLVAAATCALLAGSVVGAVSGAVVLRDPR